MDEPTFRFFFNRRKQWCDVFLDDVTPRTFHRRKGGRWAYFVATWDNPRAGRFGEIHFVKSRIRPDVIAHELDHLRTEWMFSKKRRLTRHSEELWAQFLDYLVRSFYREYKKSNKSHIHRD